ncbi:MAG: DNA repair protein RecO [Deltaproteobacteria bacterium]|nr:DNA repair protein RecO [Deltaproteobacteria bacterium]
MDRSIELAVVVSAVDYGEADRIVTLLTEHRGRVSAFAAGARKSKRRFAGALEPGTLLRAHLVARRGSTWRLDSVDLDRSHLALRTDLPRLSRALYALELCRELVRDEQPHPALFRILVEYLGQLEANRAGPTSLIAFELAALGLAGFMPRFSACALCGGGLVEPVRFDADHGGCVCGPCGLRTAHGVPVSRELAAALAGLQAGERTPMPADQRARARELLNRFVAHQLGRRLNAVDFMAQLGLD